ncbi:MAG: TIGR03943 family protein [Chloroflexota bacterium]|jgi:putative membrane protein
MMRFKLIAKIIIFISLGLFLAGRVFGGTLSYYIHPRFNGLVAATAIGLILVGIIYAVQQRRQLLGLSGNHDHDHESDDHGHQHHDHAHPGHSHELGWLGLGILLIPVVLGVAVEPRPLGAPALSNREVTAGRLTSAQAPGGSSLSFISADGERNILDWLYLFQTSENPAEFDGERASVVGFVYRDERFLESQFMISRFIVSCCVADAFPVGLIVSWPETSGIPEDQWVEVTGHFEERDFDGFKIPVLVADSVIPTEPPPQPYLYQ